MAEAKLSPTFHPAEAFPVSETIAAEMEARGWDAREVARRMQRQRQGGTRTRKASSLFAPATASYVESLLRPDHEITAIDALRLRRAFGISMEFWLASEAYYRAWLSTKDTLAAAPDGSTG